MTIQVPISPGELIDKITILEIKKQEITDSVKLANVTRELELIEAIMNSAIVMTDELRALQNELRTINKKMWDTENDVREFWDDDTKCLEAARGSHYQNDERARVKRIINDILGSEIIEEKAHPAYEYKG